MNSNNSPQEHNEEIIVLSTSQIEPGTPASPPPVPNPKKKKNKTKRIIAWIIAGVAIVLLLAVAGIGGLIYYIIDRDFRLTPSEVAFESDGGTAVIEVEGPDNWRLLSTPKAWNSVGREGDCLYCSVGENESFARKDSVVIGNDRHSVTLIVTQESGAFYASPSQAEAMNGGETLRITISGQSDWYINSGPQGWCSAYRDGSTLVLNVSENYGGGRYDEIELKSGSKTLSIPVIQTGALKAASMTAQFGSSGGTKRIEISGPDNWNCSSNEYWLDVEREGDRLMIECEKNDDDYSRDATVRVWGGGQEINISVTQSKKSTSTYYNNWGWGWW